MTELQNSSTYWHWVFTAWKWEWEWERGWDFVMLEGGCSYMGAYYPDSLLSSFSDFWANLCFLLYYNSFIERSKIAWQNHWQNDKWLMTRLFAVTYKMDKIDKMDKIGGLRSNISFFLYDHNYKRPSYLCFLLWRVQW